ncbi:MAG: (2Fe-2S) ferredoxin domain-containing protein [Candidatus Omnitrophica bacterium]|nr:(2Fe-2S) ferredoxin domain-containing protein [Candidatus Omnitrophota bacterium]
MDALKASVARHGLAAEVEVLGRGCFGLCRMAPNLYVEPEGIWYSKLKLEDVEEIVEKHLVGGKIVRRLVAYSPHNAGGCAGGERNDCTDGT